MVVIRYTQTVEREERVFEPKNGHHWPGHPSSISLITSWWFGLHFYPKDGDRAFLLNIGTYLPATWLQIPE